MLSSVGRLILVKSVLSALTLHYMQVFNLPTWLITHLDGIRRRFFWKGNDKCLGGHCLVNWKKCCLPKRSGGLGILDLSVQNQALLLRWLWKLKADPNVPWSVTVQNLYGSLDGHTFSGNHLVSNGLKEILLFKDFFLASITTDVNSHATLWRWTSSEIYSSSSAYSILVDPGIRSSYYLVLWKLNIPPRVKIFIWLLLQDRLLTQHNLNIQNWPTNDGCPCCPGNALETSLHLFLLCPLAKCI
ncbi:hypothetical protein LUZ61_005052 [Rhynchospora tenuis]|uniref:Reverse transcriptase zinc-binding domain-containing protein n=1 Tax=Rhynchospora tenuis TaxID=198213 RepID=A0AAD5ZNY6_9POAL|nr:hypothetical protein LUZ61_005052 [Rhynchospora tenuis]